ncbi:MAG: FAD-dependent oxidoreductase, partial [Candidatus Omnitrophica bacterium]|nr:FAD-dependent oxidoreductase [Candidatus Omnitrophota bacterium]
NPIYFLIIVLGIYILGVLYHSLHNLWVRYEDRGIVLISSFPTSSGSKEGGYTKILNKFKGIIPPMATIYDKEGNIDREAMKKLLKRVIPYVNGVFMGGSSGNLKNLSPQDIGELVGIAKEVLKEQVREDILVLAGARGRNPKKVVEYINADYEAGADAVVIPPSDYNVPEKEIPDYLETDYYKYYTEILSLTEDLGIPIVVYNIPLLCGGKNISFEVMQELSKFGRIIGVKDSSMDLKTFAQYSQLKSDNFKVFQGFIIAEHTLTGGEIEGISINPPDGIVPITTNIFPEEIAQLWDEVNKGNVDKVLELQRKHREEIDKALYSDESGKGYKYLVAGLVYALSLLGIGEGVLPQGQQSLPEELHKRVKVELERHKCEDIASSPSEKGDAEVGISEYQIRDREDILTSEFSFRNLGIAYVLGETKGEVKIYVDKESHRILGAKIIGSYDEELARVIRLGMNLDASIDDLADLVYAHPTLPEAIGEVAEAGLGRAIHLLPRTHKRGEPQKSNEYDVVVIGAGPAGYVGAIRAAQLGKKVVIIEKEKLGGTCLNIGCIPTKIILEAIKSKEVSLSELKKQVENIISGLIEGIKSLVYNNGVNLIEGKVNFKESSFEGEILEIKVGERIIQAKNIILAMGSRPADLPGLEINHTHIIDSTDALELDIPQQLTIIGAGAIGLEFAYIYKSLGCEKIKVVEMARQILPGILDEDMAKILQEEMEKQGIEFELGKVFDVNNLPQGRILIAVGRRLNTEGLTEKGIVLDNKGAVVVNENYQVRLKNQEFAPNIFAIGDIAGRQLLAHKAYKEAKIASEFIVKRNPNILDYNLIPAVIFTSPQVAIIGIKEEVRKDIKVKYLQTDNGRNKFKLILNNETDQLLGVTIIGPIAPYAIAEFALALKMKARLCDLVKPGLTLNLAKEVDLEEWKKEKIKSTPL